MEILQQGRGVFLNAQTTSDEVLAADKTITVFADGGSGEVDVTITAHGWAVGDRIIINGTTNYDGMYKIVGSADVNTISIIATWVSDDGTGTANKNFDGGIGLVWIPEDGDITLTVLKSGLSGSAGKGDWLTYAHVHQVEFKGVKGGAYLTNPCIQVNSFTGTIADIRVSH
jgi:hypothetical protein